MNHSIDIAEASVYVGTYRKYNEGSLFGKWLKLSDYPDRKAFYAACYELHKDEEDPELMFQDHENIPDGLISESWLSDNIFDVLQAIETMDDDQQAAFMIWCNNGHRNLSKQDIADLISAFQADYIGQYDSEEDFAAELIEGRQDLSDFARQYFDYRAYANDLFCSGYWIESGHVFYNS